MLIKDHPNPTREEIEAELVLRIPKCFGGMPNRATVRDTLGEYMGGIFLPPEYRQSKSEHRAMRNTPIEVLLDGWGKYLGSGRLFTLGPTAAVLHGTRGRCRSCTWGGWLEHGSHISSPPHPFPPPSTLSQTRVCGGSGTLHSVRPTRVYLVSYCALPIEETSEMLMLFFGRETKAGTSTDNPCGEQTAKRARGDEGAASQGGGRSASNIARVVSDGADAMMESPTVLGEPLPDRTASLLPTAAIAVLQRSSAPTTRVFVSSGKCRFVSGGWSWCIGLLPICINTYRLLSAFQPITADISLPPTYVG